MDGENHEKIKELPADGIMESQWDSGMEIVGDGTEEIKVDIFDHWDGIMENLRDRIMEIAGNGSEEIKEDLAISVSW